MSRSKVTEYKQVVRNFWAPEPHFTEADYPDLTGKTYVITGGHSGVGLEATKLLIGKGAKVIIVGRNREGAKEVLSQLPDGQFDFAQANLADLTTIADAGKYIAKNYPEIHGVILNAGVMTPPYSLTAQGHELQWGTNVVGHHALQKFLDPILIKTAKKSPPGTVRLVWVSSSATVVTGVDGGIQFDDINYEKTENPSPHVLYSQSKIGNAYQAYLWSKNHPDSGVVSVSLDPGNLKSNLQRHTTQFLKMALNYVLYPAQYGAYTELAALLAPDVKDGDHLIPWGVPGHLRGDVDAGRKGEKGEKLWDILEGDVKDYVKESYL